MSKRERYPAQYEREIVELVRRSRSSCRQLALEVSVTRTCSPAGFARPSRLAGRL